MKLKQCTCCKFFASKGSLYNGEFVCRDCEQDEIESQEREHEDATWAELCRLEQEERIVRMW